MAAKIKIDLEVDDKGRAVLSKVTETFKEMKTEAEKAGKATEETGKKFDNVTKIVGIATVGFHAAAVALGALTAAVAAVGFILFKITSAIAQTGDELSKMSIRIGISVKDLSQLRIMAGLSDTSLESLARGMRFLAQQAFDASRGITTAKLVFEELKINTLGKTSIQIFMETARAIGSIEDPFKRAALASRVFERRGAEMLPLLVDLAKRGNEFAEIIMRIGLDYSKVSPMAVDFNDRLFLLKKAFESTKLIIGEALLPIFIEMVKLLTEAALQTKEWFEANKLWLSASLQIAFEDMISALNTMLPVIRDIAAYFADAAQGAKLFFLQINASGGAAQIYANLMTGVATPEQVRMKIEEQRRLLEIRRRAITPMETGLGLGPGGQLIPIERPRVLNIAESEAIREQLQPFQDVIEANTRALALYVAEQRKVVESAKDVATGIDTTTQKFKDMTTEIKKAQEALFFINQLMADTIEKATPAQTKFVGDFEENMRKFREAGGDYIEFLKLAQGMTFEQVNRLGPSFLKYLDKQRQIMLESVGGTNKAQEAMFGFGESIKATTGAAEKQIDVFRAMLDVMGGFSNLLSQLGIKTGFLGNILGGFSAFRTFAQGLQQMGRAGPGGIRELLGLAPAAGVTVVGGANQAGTGATVAGVGAGAGGGILRFILPAGIGMGAGALTQGLFGNLGTGARAGIGAGIGVGAGLGVGALSTALGIGGASQLGFLGLSAIGGPIGLAIGGIIGGLMALFGGRRQRPSERLVAAQQGGQFMELFQQGLMGPSGRTLEQFLGYGNFQDPSSRLFAPGMVEAGGAYATALRGGRMDRAAAESFIAESRALIQRLSSADIEMSENTVKLVNTLIDMTDTIAETIGDSQQQLEQSLTSLIQLEGQITTAILQINQPTMGAQITAFAANLTDIWNEFNDPSATTPERIGLLNQAFQEVTSTTQTLVGRLQEMAAENQSAARAIEGLNAQITNLNKTEEAHRRGLAAVAFDVSLGGLQVPEATRLQRVYMASEAARLRGLLEGGTVTGAERVRVAEQAQALAQEIYQSYAMDQTMSLSDIDAVQVQVLQALGFIDTQLATGYAEQRSDLQEQIDTQQGILDANVNILTDTFGVRTAAEALVIIKRDAVDYLRTIRDETITLGSSIATELAPLLDATSPLWTQMNMAANSIATNNTLLDGLSNVNAPLDAIQAETVNTTTAVSGISGGIGAILRPLLTALPTEIAANLRGIFGPGLGTIPAGGGPGGQGPLGLVSSGAWGQLSANAERYLNLLENVGPGSAIEVAIRKAAIGGILPGLPGVAGSTVALELSQLQSLGYTVLPHGGTVQRTGMAIVEEGERVIPRGGSAFPERITIEQPLQLTINNLDGTRSVKEFILETIVDASGHGRLKVKTDGTLVR